MKLMQNFLNILYGAILIFLIQQVVVPTENSLKKDYYESEVAVLVSPHSLRENILHGENKYILVDTRDGESYINGHIVGAINISPGPKMIEQFRELGIEKEILIYCYTQVCLRGRKIGLELSKNGIYVRELGIGFNEWKNYWRTWNYENEWGNVDIDKYIVFGKDPGEFSYVERKNILNSSCSTVPGFEC